MDHRASTLPPGVEYHRVLAGGTRRIGRGLLAIALLIGGLAVSTVVLTAGAALVDAAIGIEGRVAYTPLIHAAGMVSVALLIPWSMLIQRWLYGVRGASLHSVVSRFRFDVFGRALLLIVPAWVVALVFQYWSPLPQTAWTYSDVLWMLVATILLTPLQAAGEEYGLRGLVLRVAGGWTRGARAGLAVGVLVSSGIFAVIHLSTDPWLNLWYLIFAVGTALITWRTGGIEIAVVVHAGYNTLSFVFEAAFRVDLATVATDRSAGAGSAAVLIPGAVVVATALLVWLRTRRIGPARTPELGQQPPNRAHGPRGGLSVHRPDPDRAHGTQASLDPATVAFAVQAGHPAVDDSRPFGAHLRMSWWKPLILLVTLPLVLVVSQWLSWQIVGVIEGSDDPLSPEFTPLKSAAVNLAIGATGLVAILLLVWMTRVPWRLLFSSRRAFDGRRLVHYAIGAALLVAAGAATVALVAPESTGWTGFAITGTTIALLAVTLLTIPIQSTGEELIYRSVLLPAAASWVRPVRPALALGLVVSALAFTATHGATDPWLAGYFTVVGLSTGLMAIISGGVEAPIAFHVANNVLAGVITNLMSGGGTSTVDRSTETGGPSLLILVAVNIGMVTLVWAHERRRRATR
jgi:membrane protease YdiL (CAAX protease family)